MRQCAGALKKDGQWQAGFPLKPFDQVQCAVKAEISAVLLRTKKLSENSTYIYLSLCIAMKTQTV